METTGNESVAPVCGDKLGGGPSQTEVGRRASAFRLEPKSEDNSTSHDLSFTPILPRHTEPETAGVPGDPFEIPGIYIE